MTALELERDRLLQLRDKLRDRDWREVTTEELAEAAGLSRMTLHRRGIAKDTVLSQLGRMLDAEYREAVFPALVSSETAPVRLRQALGALCEVSERYLGLLDALGAANVFLFHEEGEGAVQSRGALTDALRRILEDGVAEGTLRADDPVETGTLLFNATSWTYRHMRLGHRWDVERVRGQLIELLADGVRA